MKKTFTLILFLVPLMAFSQEQGILIDSTMTFQYMSHTDSTIYGKVYFERNYSGKTFLQTSFLWDSNLNGWIGLNRTEYDYDAGGHQVMYAYYTWDAGLNDWTGTDKLMTGLGI